MKEFTPDQLRSFLVRAKAATYASGGEPAVLSDGSKELAFEEGKFKYRDRYFGSDPFVGEEIVLYDGQVVWAMNYYGAVCSETVPANEVYRFLMKALTPRLGKAGRFEGQALSRSKSGNIATKVKEPSSVLSEANGSSTWASKSTNSSTMEEPSNKIWREKK